MNFIYFTNIKVSISKLSVIFRYWYENDIPPSSFTREQLNEIRKVSLSRVICDNIPTIDFVQPKVFLNSDPFLNALMPCGREGNSEAVNLKAAVATALAVPGFVLMSYPEKKPIWRGLRRYLSMVSLPRTTGRYSL